jgi:hypothetical protein
MNALNLGIKKDLVAKAGIPIDPPIAIDKATPFFKSYIFPIVLLSSVTFVPDQVTKDSQTQEETTQPVLKFVFTDTQNGEKKITDVYYPLDPTDDKFEMKLEGLQKSIKHIFEETIGASHFNEEDFSGTSFAELFENSANAFNKIKTIKKPATETSEEVSVLSFTTVPMYFKVVYYNNRLITPMYPNFVQRAYIKKDNSVLQVPCELAVGKKDVVINKSDAKPAASGMGVRGNGFGGAVAGFGLDASSGAMEDMVFPE